MTSRSRSEDISLGRHALTSKPRLTPRLGLCQSMSPSTDIFRSGTRGHSWFSYSCTCDKKIPPEEGFLLFLSGTARGCLVHPFVILLIYVSNYDVTEQSATFPAASEGCRDVKEKIIMASQCGQKSLFSNVWNSFSNIWNSFSNI